LFNPGDTQCLPSEQEKGSSTPIGSSVSVNNLVSQGTGSYKYNGPGPFTLHGGTVPAGKNISLFVKGDVYIANDGNVTYDNSGRTVDNVQSFVLHATGNIYIDPNVTTLEGLYTAETDGAPVKNTIYTCATGPSVSQLVQKNDLLNTCKNQLTVYGSFVADRVNMMRTYGSLRDEKIQNPPKQVGFFWCNGAANCKDLLGGLNCVTIDEPSEPASHNWADNKLCVPPSSGVGLKWYNNIATKAAAESAAGFGYHCINFDANQAGEAGYWADNWLCTTASGLTFSKNGNEDINTRYCGTWIYEDSDPDANNFWQGKARVCEPKAGVGVIPTSFDCSNAGTASFLRISTCAAEVFDFNPELYIPDADKLQIKSPSDGALQWDSVTNLPPVL
jgi:hypothetical protein